MPWADIMPLSKIINPKRNTEPYYGEFNAAGAIGTKFCENDHHLALDVDLDLVGPSEFGSAVISRSRGEWFRLDNSDLIEIANRALLV